VEKAYSCSLANIISVFQCAKHRTNIGHFEYCCALLMDDKGRKKSLFFICSKILKKVVKRSSMPKRIVEKYYNACILSKYNLTTMAAVFLFYLKRKYNLTTMAVVFPLYIFLIKK